MGVLETTVSFYYNLLKRWFFPLILKVVFSFSRKIYLSTLNENLDCTMMQFTKLLPLDWLVIVKHHKVLIVVENEKLGQIAILGLILINFV